MSATKINPEAETANTAIRTHHTHRGGGLIETLPASARAYQIERPNPIGQTTIRIQIGGSNWFRDGRQVAGGELSLNAIPRWPPVGSGILATVPLDNPDRIHHASAR